MATFCYPLLAVGMGHVKVEHQQSYFGQRLPQAPAEENALRACCGFAALPRCQGDVVLSWLTLEAGKSLALEVCHTGSVRQRNHLICEMIRWCGWSSPRLQDGCILKFFATGWKRDAQLQIHEQDWGAQQAVSPKVNVAGWSNMSSPSSFFTVRCVGELGALRPHAADQHAPLGDRWTFPGDPEAPSQEQETPRDGSSSRGRRSLRPTTNWF